MANNNRRRDFNVDYTQPGQLATQQQLAQMLQNAQQQQYQQPTRRDCAKTGKLYAKELTQLPKTS